MLSVETERAGETECGVRTGEGGLRPVCEPAVTAGREAGAQDISLTLRRAVQATVTTTSSSSSSSYHQHNTMLPPLNIIDDHFDEKNCQHLPPGSIPVKSWQTFLHGEMLTGNPETNMTGPTC